MLNTPSDVNADRMNARASDANVVDLLAWKESAVLRDKGSVKPALAPSIETYSVSVFAVVVALVLFLLFLRRV